LETSCIPKVAVGGRVVELCGVDQARFHRRLDFTARQLHNGHAHFEQNVSSEADGPVLQPLHLAGVGDLLLEPS
jgi:hypothetical protein